MNCRRVEKLIPLYVEGDLASGVADRLTSHLEWCGRCNWLADEYRESQRWLRTGGATEFDPAFLENFKAGVLRQIEKDSANPSLLASLVRQWGRRQVLALSAALLIIFGALVFYIYQVRMRGNATPLQAVKEMPRPETTPPNTPRLGPHTEPAKAIGSTRDHSKKHRRFNSPDRNQIAARQRPEQPLLSQTNRVPEPGKASSEPTSALPISDDPPEMLRIEIETGDPNIRIIWFAPKEVESPQINQ